MPRPEQLTFSVYLKEEDLAVLRATAMKQKISLSGFCLSAALDKAFDIAALERAVAANNNGVGGGVGNPRTSS